MLFMRGQKLILWKCLDMHILFSTIYLKDICPFKINEFSAMLISQKNVLPAYTSYDLRQNSCQK